jgi:hypothetical protein
MQLASPIAFPDTHPDGYAPLEKEPEFVPSRHLALERPEKITSLGELGYGGEDVASCPSDFGVTSPFRMLTEEGAEAMLEVARLLEPYCTGNFRISRNVRGGVYRSKFLRDLCISPDVSAFVSDVTGAPMLPHTMPHQLGHINYAPEIVGENVDKWHTDTLRVDYVLFVTDPKTHDGGEFQYFKGTRHEMEAVRARGESVPAEKIVSPPFPDKGYAVLQQGNMVVHRAKGLNSPGERMTMVSAYVPAEIGFPDFTRYDQLYMVDPKNASTAEFSRQTAWMAEQMLRQQVDSPLYVEDREAHLERLRSVRAVLDGAITQIETADEAEEEHFGDG